MWVIFDFIDEYLLRQWQPGQGASLRCPIFDDKLWGSVRSFFLNWIFGKWFILELGHLLLIRAELFFEVGSDGVYFFSKLGIAFLEFGVYFFFKFGKTAQDKLELFAYVILSRVGRLIIKLVSLACWGLCVMDVHGVELRGGILVPNVTLSMVSWAAGPQSPDFFRFHLWQSILL